MTLSSPELTTVQRESNREVFAMGGSTLSERRFRNSRKRFGQRGAMRRLAQANRIAGARNPDRALAR